MYLQQSVVQLYSPYGIATKQKQTKHQATATQVKHVRAQIDCNDFVSLKATEVKS